MKRLQYMKVWLVVPVIVGLLLTPFANAQEILSQQEDTREQFFLSLEETINIALENNLDIRIEKYNPEIEQETIKEAESAFDSKVSAGSSQAFNESESPSSPTSTTGIEGEIGKQFTTGASYQFGLEMGRSGFDELDDQYSVGLELKLTQPLLKNRGTDVNTIAISIARKNREISISELRATIIEIVSDIKNTYWKLIYVRGDLEAKRLSLQLAYDLVRINEAQVKVGTLAPIEVLQAQTTAATREVEIISAEQTVQDVEDELKRLLGISEDAPMWEAAIIPTDTPLSTKQPVSLNESIQLALENIEGLKQLQKATEIQELSVKASQNQLLPNLNLQGSFSLTGQDDSFGGSFGNIPDFDTYSFGVGASFSYPLGNNAAKSSLKKAELELDKTRLSIQNSEQQIITQVKQVVRGVETSYKLVEATKIARELAEQQLDAEQKKFNEGLSTNFQVLSYQDSLATAQSRETQALTSYNQALVGLDQVTGITLQRHNIEVSE
jgi:outer membrane protein TolC